MPEPLTPAEQEAMEAVRVTPRNGTRRTYQAPACPYCGSYSVRLRNMLVALWHCSNCEREWKWYGWLSDE